MATFGSLISQARKLAGLTQQELADRLGVDQGSVAKLENNKIKRPNPEILEGLERHLGLSRYEMNIALGNLPQSQEIDFTAEVRRIALIQDEQARAEAIRKLPIELQEAIDSLLRARLADLMAAARK